MSEHSWFYRSDPIVGDSESLGSLLLKVDGFDGVRTYYKRWSWQSLRPWCKTGDVPASHWPGRALFHHQLPGSPFPLLASATPAKVNATALLAKERLWL